MSESEPRCPQCHRVFPEFLTAETEGECLDCAKRNAQLIPILIDGLGSICSLMHVPPEMAPDVLKLIGVISGLLYGGVTARWTPDEVKADFIELLNSMAPPNTSTKEEAEVAIAKNLATLEKFFQKIIAPIEVADHADVPEGTSIQ